MNVLLALIVLGIIFYMVLHYGVQNHENHGKNSGNHS